jgi:acylphosphatase
LAEQARRHIVVTGRVQGVFFRDSVKRHALDRGLAGWVRNNDDGTVEAVFEGGPEDVEALVAFCRAGPENASVDDVNVSDEEPTGETGFQVR